MSSSGRNGTGNGSLSSTSKHKIIVGVDYGTTFTGVSYVSSERSGINDINIIRSWPGSTRDIDTIFKAPSRIAYPADNQRIGNQRWGFQVEPGMTAYSWTKLLLDQNTPLTEYDDASLEDASGMGILRLPDGKEAVDIVSDFLALVHKHIIQTIAKQITEETLHITPLEFWFTVPAIWSDQAKDATREAARRAGFCDNRQRPSDTVFMISEPEAAAIAALKQTTVDGLGASVEPGDGVLVCDCGGGTVDITTYLVNTVSPALSFEEVCTGIGGKCGSTAVDRNFYNLMSSRFGDDFDLLPAQRKGPGSDFMKQFDIIKRDFGYSTEEMTHELPLNMTVTDPDPQFFDEEERRVRISDEDLRSIFDPVVAQIIDLVCQQIEDADEEAGEDTVNRIVLVGGFGDSDYLGKAFKKEFDSNGMIDVTVPHNPQAAIVQGAALRGLEGLRSTTKRCRRHYGFKWSTAFRDGIDEEIHSFICPFTKSKRVKGIMKWMIAKGEKYTDDFSYTVGASSLYYPGDPLKQYIQLYSCDLTQPPERVESEDVRPVGGIVTDFTNVDLDRFCRKKFSGELVYQLAFKLKVNFGSRDGVLRFEASTGGQVVGNTTINFTPAKYY